MEQLELIKGSKIVLGVSGGPDSVYLLDVLAKKKVNLVVAHLNHGIRKESDSDEKFVKKLAEKYGYEFVSKKVKIKGTGVEEKSREERYKFFQDVKKKYKAKYIATAHTLDDNLETVLLNIVRGCSLKGLNGMQVKNGDLIRPLLNTEKSEILKYLKKNGLKFRIDKTNEDTKYSRNFIRLKIVPELKKLNPNLPQTFGANLANIQEVTEFLEEKAQNWIAKNFENDRYPLKKFQKLHPALQKTVIQLTFQKIKNSKKDLQKDHMDEILSIVRKGIGRKHKTFQRVRIEILKKNIVFSLIR
ncbi:MAG: tRNA lysidine(34) synthetase TilS [Patescibacteria group bacterium]